MYIRSHICPRAGMGTRGGTKRKVASIEEPSRSLRKNPRRAARVLSDSYFNTTVIKCTFNPLTRFAVVANEVRGCVETMAMVFYHTHLAMLLLLSRNKGSGEGECRGVDARVLDTEEVK